MVFDPETEKRVRRQTEQEQLRLRADDYHAAKWLGLEDKGDETALPDKTPDLPSAVNGEGIKKEADKKNNLHADKR
jgi:hypothetical protein